MSEDKGGSRRDFFRTLGAASLAGAATLAGTGAVRVQAAGQPAKAVPRRPFGRQGVDVSMLSLGGMFDVPNGQVLLHQALRLGVDYWDTANSYGHGKSEEGFGKFFAANPEQRQRVFLVTKSTLREPEDLQAHLDLSLQRLNTSYIDLFFLHSVKQPGELTDDIARWADKARAAGKIKLMGFSTHANMPELLMAASKKSWVQGIMSTYNYAVMKDPAFADAVAACHAAGIGLTAMKTQCRGPFDNPGDDLGLAERFVANGYTPEQAKLKAVWTDPKLASLCSQMPNLTLLLANAAAAMDRTSLSPADLAWLRQHAEGLCGRWCAGCAQVCESAVGGAVPVAEVLRCLMYRRAYGEPELARQEFARVVPDGPEALAGVDYAAAEAACPQRLGIARLMDEARRELA